MKLLTRNTDYAVRAICYMAKNKDRVIPVPEFARELSIPRPFLRKVLQILNKKGIVRSYKGLGGGFRIVVEPGRIFLVKLVEIFQGPLRLNECTLKKVICPNRKKCPLKKKIDRIEKYMLSELGTITISSLIRG